MVNTGTWNSDLAFIFVALFFLPLFLHFIMGCMIRARQLTEKPYIINIYEEIEHETPYKSQPKEKKPAHKTKPKQKTEKDVISLEAISGLVGLGYKRSEARRIVASARSNKDYKKAEDIIMDAMANCV